MEGLFEDFPEVSYCKIPLKTVFIKGNREEFLRAVRANQVLVVMVENDFGNSNRILQYLYEDGSYTQSGPLIACTQPTSVAPKSSNKSIRFTTDTMLLREYVADPDHAFVNYGVIMVDQAHERTVSTDLLLALLKGLARVRPDLKLIISTSSVTHQTQKLSAYFDDAPVFAFPGGGNDVKILYIKEAVTDYLDVAIETAGHIHAEYRNLPGDILIFLPGVGLEEIESAIEELSLNKIESTLKDISLKNHRATSSGWGALTGTELVLCPIFEYDYSTLLQQPIHQGARKVFFATDDAHVSSIGMNTSIKFVIDSGLCNLKWFDPRTGMESLVVGPVSKESAWRRAYAAVCGGPEGKCFRLYTQEHYLHELEDFTLPEIQRANLTNVVLILKSLGVEDLSSFDFVDRPSSESLNRVLDRLCSLGALDKLGRLTQVGRKMMVE